MMTSSNLSMCHRNFVFCLDMEMFNLTWWQSLFFFLDIFKVCLVFSSVSVRREHHGDQRQEITNILYNQFNVIYILVSMFKICLFSLVRQTLKVPNLHNKDIKAFHILWFLDLLVMFCRPYRASPTKNAELISIINLNLLISDLPFIYWAIKRLSSKRP